MNLRYLIIKDPIGITIGFLGRIIDYIQVLISLFKKKIPKKAYNLALLRSYLNWHNGEINDFENGLIKIQLTNQNSKIESILRNSTSDLLTFAEVIMSKEYQLVVDFIKENKQKEPKLIIDVGANIGLTTVFFKSHFPNSRIICIEPDQDNSTILKKNISVNNLDKCEVLINGIWHSDQKLQLSNDFRDGLSWSTRVIAQENGEITGLSIESLLKKCQQEVIDILKLDIEGTEFELFRHSSKILPLLRQSRCIIIEVHQEFGDSSEIIEVLNQADFLTFRTGHLLLAANLTKFPKKLTSI